MVNVTVINKKDVIKYLVKILLAIVIVGIFTRYFSVLKKGKAYAKEGDNTSNKILLTKCLDKTIPNIEQITDKDENNNMENMNIRKMAIHQELSVLDYIDKDEKNDLETKKLEEDQSSITFEEYKNNEDEKIENQETTKTELAKVGVKTEVQPTDVPDKYTNTYSSVHIKNESEKDITDDIINPEGVKINNKNVLIFHTHTCESYTPTEKNNYDQTGSFRTTDLEYTVCKVGDELEKQLKNYDFNVIHNKDYHDYPAYTGSYERSFNTVQDILDSNNNYDVVFDIHRDAIADSSYAPTVKIGDEYVAQIMFVIGTNGSGLDHPNWKQNLKFAVKVQEKANEMYPGLFKSIIVRDSRYNQNLAKAASIIEVGATGNTLEEACNSMKYLARVLNEVVK